MRRAPERTSPRSGNTLAWNAVETGVCTPVLVPMDLDTTFSLREEDLQWLGLVLHTAEVQTSRPLMHCVAVADL